MERPPLSVALDELDIDTVPVISIWEVNVISPVTSIYAPSAVAEDRSENVETEVVATAAPIKNSRPMKQRIS